jgi:lysozyme family protein
LAKFENKLVQIFYNTFQALCRGQILFIQPQTHIPFVFIGLVNQILAQSSHIYSEYLQNVSPMARIQGNA